jgi:hypothetical protein
MASRLSLAQLEMARRWFKGFGKMAASGVKWSCGSGEGHPVRRRQRIYNNFHGFVVLNLASRQKFT